MNRSSFRDVCFNISPGSISPIVEGTGLPYQCLYNTVEGGGRTLSRGGKSSGDLSKEQKEQLEKLAFAGRLLQSHFSPDYTFSTPLDIEWLANENGFYLLQVRPELGAHRLFGRKGRGCDARGYRRLSSLSSPIRSSQ